MLVILHLFYSRQLRKVLPMGFPALTRKAALAASLALPFGLAMRAQQGFHVNKQLYDETADPAADIARAERAAAGAHKRILLDFGGNWCGDCQVMEYNFHQPSLAELLANHYVVVHIDIGHIDKNLGIASKYGVQIMHGVPGLAILDARGKVLYAQHEKEFEHATVDQLQTLLARYKG